jgi:Rad3-related DNA helicase
LFSIFYRKTVCLLSLITSYQFANPSAGKLVYCTRTVPEMNHVMEELAVVLAYRAEELAEQEQQEQENLQPDTTADAATAVADAAVADTAGRGRASEDIEDSAGLEGQSNNSNNAQQASSSSSIPSAAKKPRVYKREAKQQHRTGGKPPMGPIANGKGAGGSGILALCLSSRRNMCIHERVMAESDREAVDAACRTMTASWSTEKCPYYENFNAAGEATLSMPSGVYDLEELQKWGRQRGWCPYYLTRRAINHANVLIYNYQYMLDPKVGTQRVLFIFYILKSESKARVLSSSFFSYSASIIVHMLHHSQNGIQRFRSRNGYCV